MTHVELAPEIGAIPDESWEGWDDLDTLGRLATTIRVGDYFMHLEAIAVSTDDSGRQRALLNGSLDKIKEAVGVDQRSTFETITLRGQEFILVATPFGV
jgi:hypothetical protein